MQRNSLTLALGVDVREQLLLRSDGHWSGWLGDNVRFEESPNFWPGRLGHRVRCVVWHITDGTGSSALSWLTSPGSDASANDLIMESGELVQLVRGDDAPWTNGPISEPNLLQPVVRSIVGLGYNPNLSSYTIESAGKSGRWSVGSLRDAQIVTLILRTAQACIHFGLSANAEHILRHSDFDNRTRHDCPGFAQSEMSTWIDAVGYLTRSARGW